MIVFLKKTIAHINRETSQGNAVVASGKQENDAACAPCMPPQVDAVTSGTQAISHYFAARDPMRPGEPDTT